MKDFLTPPLTGAKLKQSALLLISSFLRETGISHETWSIESERTLRESEGQGSVACCSPWGHRVRSNWATEQQWSVEIPSKGKTSVTITCSRAVSANLFLLSPGTWPLIT